MSPVVKEVLDFDGMSDIAETPFGGGTARRVIDYDCMQNRFAPSPIRFSLFLSQLQQASFLSLGNFIALAGLGRALRFEGSAVYSFLNSLVGIYGKHRITHTSVKVSG